jgi:O-antigen ligase/cytochrome c-type biogenesis protein CcmH/NrfG
VIAPEGNPAGLFSVPRRKGWAHRAEALPLVLLVGFLAAVACVPDEAILRSKVTWTEGLLILAATAALLVQVMTGRIRTPWPLLLVGGLLPAAIALLQTLTRTDLVSRALARDEVERLLLFPLAFWCVASSLRSDGARRVFVGALSLAVLVVSAYAVAQNLGAELGLPIDRFERPPSTFGNPVFLGAFLVLAAPLCAAEALFGTGWRRWAGAVATGLALPALRATQSRWAWLAFAVAVGVGMLMLAPTARQRRLLFIGLLGAGVLVLLLNRSVVKRPQQHALIWRDTFVMAADRPWGIGPGQFPLVFLNYASRELLDAYPPSAFVINDAHDEPLQIFAELGWPGFAAVVLLALVVLRRAARSAVDPASDPDRPLRVACFAALTGALVQSLGSPDLRFLISMMMLGTVAGVSAAFDEVPARELRVPRALRVVLVPLIVTAAVLALRDVVGRLELAELLQPREPVSAAAQDAPAVPPEGPQLDPDELIAQRRAEVQAQPRDASRRYALGLAFARERRYAEAAESFRSALLLEPHNVSVIRSLGVTEGLSGQFAPAVHHLRVALESERENVELRYLFAYVCWRRGDLDTSASALEAVLAARPDHRQARLLLQKLRE